MKKAVSATEFFLLIERSKSSLSQDFKGTIQAGFPADIILVNALILKTSSFNLIFYLSTNKWITSPLKFEYHP